MRLQPHDRSTGTDLSSDQQEDCQSHYAVIKSYIDTLDCQPATSIPWSRKKLQCSSDELLASLGATARRIQKTEQQPRSSNDLPTIIYSQNGPTTDGSQEFSSQDIIYTPEFYQNAVNLLHELVSRFAEVETSLEHAPASTLLDESRVDHGSSLPVSVSCSSGISSATSSAFSTATPCSVPGSTKSEHNKDTEDAEQPGRHGRLGYVEQAYEPFLFEDASEESRPRNLGTSRESDADKWALEYLRGGWLTNSSVLSTESRTTSDMPNKRGSRPIPTMTSRLIQQVMNQESPSVDVGATTASGPDHFRTPKSILSGATVFCTPDPGSAESSTNEYTGPTSTWNAYLRTKGLIPEPFEEMNWSGRGQHAEFDATEESEIPLTLEKNLGFSRTAIVESVRCRRIRLARKTVKVSRRLRKEEAIKEVEHLQRLRHPHILRVVGTYTLPHRLSILLYPVAEYTLDQFLESTQDDEYCKDRPARMYSISTFVRCLAKALAYIHHKAMKHMDIKPQNLLIRDMRKSKICNQGQYKIYIADFGIARSYRSVEDCNTETPTAFTKIYAAPEVIAQEARDQKADIFSLGAVYAEMFAVLGHPSYPTTNTSNLDLLSAIRETDCQDVSYQAHTNAIQAWLRRLSVTSYGFGSHINELVARMLSLDPNDRPTAATLVNNIPFLAFCCDVNGGSEPFEAAEPPTDRQLYDRAFQISEAHSSCFRCMVDGCVKVYTSPERLEYHELTGHGGVSTSVGVPEQQNGPLRKAMDHASLLHAVQNGEEDNLPKFDKALHEEVIRGLRWS